MFTSIISRELENEAIPFGSTSLRLMAAEMNLKLVFPTAFITTLKNSCLKRCTGSGVLHKRKISKLKAA